MSECFVLTAGWVCFNGLNVFKIIYTENHVELKRKKHKFPSFIPTKTCSFGKHSTSSLMKVEFHLNIIKIESMSESLLMLTSVLFWKHQISSRLFNIILIYKNSWSSKEKNVWLVKTVVAKLFTSCWVFPDYIFMYFSNVFPFFLI